MMCPDINVPFWCAGDEEPAGDVFHQEGCRCAVASSITRLGTSAASPRSRVTQRAHHALSGIVTGSQKPGHTTRSSISLKHVYEIAKARAKAPARGFMIPCVR